MTAVDALSSRLEARGRPASPGLARGPLVVWRDVAVSAGSTGTAEEEQARLVAAVAAAAAEVAALIGRQDDPEAAAILEFQLAMLEDETLVEGPVGSIADGHSALDAFSSAMAVMVAEYRAADDEYFQARAADLEDLADRVTGHLTGRAASDLSLPPGGILFARDLTPSRFLSIDWSDGRAAALAEGSPTAHVAILARSRGVPLVVGLGDIPAERHGFALLDADAGRLVLSPSETDEAAHAVRLSGAVETAEIEARLVDKPAIAGDGTRIAVMINVGDPTELDRLSPEICDGIGLVRSEFLFHGRKDLPGEDEQVAAYARILAWAGERPVVIRTLDAGGDKPIPGLTRDEANPFLGLRGVRLSLARPDVFRVQIRALLRSAVAGNLKVMAPMIALPAEMTAVRRLFGEEAQALKAAGVPHAMPPLGMMVEVPAAALAVDLFDTDFLSIGSNDLTQYVMAASRDATGLDGLDDAGAVAVQRLIRMTVEGAERRGLPVSLCGDAGSDLAVLPKLLDNGLRSLSVAPAAVGRVKRAIGSIVPGGGP